MQRSFSELEYAAKKKVTRRDRFLSQIDAVTPWAELVSALAPHYPKRENLLACPAQVFRATMLSYKLKKMNDPKKSAKKFVQRLS